MSLCNVWWSPERVLVAVDTEASELGGPAQCTSKLFPLVHANMVITGRGYIGFAAGIWAKCVRLARDADETFDAMPEMLTQNFDEMAARPDAPDDIDQCESVACGWSPRHQRMLCRAWLQESRESGFVCHQLGPGLTSLVAPWPADRPELRIGGDDTAMSRAAREQVRYVREHFPSMPIGGRLVVAELTRDSMTMRTICDLG